MDYVAAYVAGSFGGHLFEAAQGKSTCDGLLQHLGLGCWPTLQLYGVGLVFLLFLHKNAGQSNIWLLALGAALLFSLLECGAGHASTAYFGKRGWAYHTGDTYCSKYNSVRVSIGWFAVSLVILALLQRFFPA